MKSLDKFNSYQGLPAGGVRAGAIGLPPKHTDKTQGVVRVQAYKGLVRPFSRFRSVIEAEVLRLSLFHEGPAQLRRGEMHVDLRVQLGKGGQGLVLRQEALQRLDFQRREATGQAKDRTAGKNWSALFFDQIAALLRTGDQLIKGAVLPAKLYA